MILIGQQLCFIHDNDRFTQRFYLKLRNTAVTVWFLFELSCMSLLLFTVMGLFFLAEGRLSVLLLYESCTNTFFFL